jgi:hypothetical protein
MHEDPGIHNHYRSVFLTHEQPGQEIAKLEQKLHALDAERVILAEIEAKENQEKARLNFISARQNYAQSEMQKVASNRTP